MTNPNTPRPPRVGEQGFVGSAEGRVIAVHPDGTLDFKSRSGATHHSVEPHRFHPYYASNH